MVLTHSEEFQQSKKSMGSAKVLNDRVPMTILIQWPYGTTIEFRRRVMKSYKRRNKYPNALKAMDLVKDSVPNSR